MFTAYYAASPAHARGAFGLARKQVRLKRLWDASLFEHAVCAVWRERMLESTGK